MSYFAQTSWRLNFKVSVIASDRRKMVKLSTVMPRIKNALLIHEVYVWEQSISSGRFWLHVYFVALTVPARQASTNPSSFLNPIATVAKIFHFLDITLGHIAEREHFHCVCSRSGTCCGWPRCVCNQYDKIDQGVLAYTNPGASVQLLHHSTMPFWTVVSNLQNNSITQWTPTYI